MLKILINFVESGFYLNTIEYFYQILYYFDDFSLEFIENFLKLKKITGKNKNLD